MDPNGWKHAQIFQHSVQHHILLYVGDGWWGFGFRFHCLSMGVRLCLQHKLERQSPGIHSSPFFVSDYNRFCAEFCSWWSPVMRTDRSKFTTSAANSKRRWAPNSPISRYPPQCSSPELSRRSHIFAHQTWTQPPTNLWVQVKGSSAHANPTLRNHGCWSSIHILYHIVHLPTCIYLWGFSCWRPNSSL